MMTNKSILGLRMSAADRKAFSVNYGKHIAKTGKYISMSDFISFKFNERFNLSNSPKIEINHSKLIQFQMNLPSDLYQRIVDEASTVKTSINKLVLIEITS